MFVQTGAAFGILTKLGYILPLLITLSAELLNKPYPKKYDTPTFILYEGQKGNALKHVSKFLDATGPHVSNGDLS